MSERNNNIDIARGLLIIIMVLGHTGFSGTKFIYLFHIPSFVFLSGYLHTSNYSYQFLKKRFVSLYFPFIKYSLIYLISINFFVEFGILNIELISFNNIFQNLLDILLMKGLGGFLGAFWYLTMILEVIFIYILFDRILKNIHYMSVFIAVLFFLIYGYIANGFTLPAYLDISFLMLSSFHFGRLYKRYEKVIPNNLYVFIISSSILLLLYLNDVEINIGSRILPNIFLYLLSIISGIFLIMSFSKVIPFKSIQNGFSYAGKSTIIILALHFFSFKVVDLIVFHFFSLESNNELSSFPTMHNRSIIFSFVYLFFGLTIPLLINKIKKN